MRKYDVKLIYEDGMWHSETADKDIGVTLERKGVFNMIYRTCGKDIKI